MTMQKDSGIDLTPNLDPEVSMIPGPPKDEANELIEADSLICPHCAQPITRFDHFCPHCHQAVTSHAMTDPMGQIYAQGNSYSRRAHSPKLIILVGEWLIMGTPMVSFAIPMILELPGIRHQRPVDDTGLFLSGIITLTLAIILWRRTVRYLKLKKQAPTINSGYCTACDYNLQGVTANKCPKCGTPIPVS